MVWLQKLEALTRMIRSVPEVQGSGVRAESSNSAPTRHAPETFIQMAFRSAVDLQAWVAKDAVDFLVD